MAGNRSVAARGAGEAACFLFKVHVDRQWRRGQYIQSQDGQRSVLRWAILGQGGFNNDQCVESVYRVSAVVELFAFVALLELSSGEFRWHCHSLWSEYRSED